MVTVPMYTTARHLGPPPGLVWTALPSYKQKKCLSISRPVIDFPERPRASRCIGTGIGRWSSGKSRIKTLAHENCAATESAWDKHSIQETEPY